MAEVSIPLLLKDFTDGVRQVVVEGDTVECWAHGSAFSLITGKPQNLPAYEPVPVYVVEIDGDDVLIDPAVTKEV